MLLLDIVLIRKGFYFMNISTQATPYSLGVIILAAGASSRMGKPKMLLPWGPTSIIGHQIKQWQSLQAQQIVVVSATGDLELKAALDLLGFPGGDRITNPRPQEGMFSSIQCAARWTGWESSLTHWAIVLGDQPHHRNTTLASLLDYSRKHPQLLCQPAHHGHPAHPIVLPKPCFLKLGDTTANNLKDFLQNLRDELASIEVDDPGLHLDIDTKEDYERARVLYFDNP
jgi:molybdenum cofactor cytidylyltransferase